MQIYVIRHGLSEANRAGQIQGQADSSLTEVGLAQAALLGRFLKSRGVAPDRIYSSPLIRAFDTACVIAGNMDPHPPVIKVPGFTEVDTGSLSGLSMEEAYSRFPDRMSGDINRWLDFSNFGGESFDALFERVEAATREIMSECDPLHDGAYIFVAHAGVMRPLLKTLLDARSDLMYFSFGNCCHLRIAWRNIAGRIRKVIEYMMTLDQAAELIGEKPPGTI